LRIHLSLSPPTLDQFEDCTLTVSKKLTHFDLFPKNGLAFFSSQCKDGITEENLVDDVTGEVVHLLAGRRRLPLSVSITARNILLRINVIEAAGVTADTVQDCRFSAGVLSGSLRTKSWRKLIRNQQGYVFCICICLSVTQHNYIHV
jgi:hypothetical protein